MNEDYFLAGGMRVGVLKFLKNLSKITLKAEIRALGPMPIKKAGFPMTFFKKNRALIILGGYDGID